MLSHFAADARLLYGELARRGYRRPGLTILRTGDRRTDHLYTATFLEAQSRVTAAPVPILRAENWDRTEFSEWFDAHRPDVVVMHQYPAYIEGVEAVLAGRGRRVPRDVGIALLDLNPAPAKYSGVLQNPRAMGAAAAEMLLGRVLLRDFAPTSPPKTEMVIGAWNEGRTLRRAPP